MNATVPSSNQVAHLNDQFRQRPGADWLVTAAVNTKGLAFVAQTIEAVRTFATFPKDNDPYGEHDFGAFDLHGQKLFWKIDCYDKNLEFGSPNAADSTVTRRIMTIMLASDY